MYEFIELGALGSGDVAKGFGRRLPETLTLRKIRHVQNLAERGWGVLCFALNASNFTSE